MGIRSTRPLMFRDANGNVFQHQQDDDKYKGFYVTSTVRYHAFARPGKEDSDAAWRISKETLGDGTYSTNETVLVEFAEGSNDYEHILDESVATTATTITKANPAQVTTSAAHGYDTGDVIYISGSDMTEVNGEFFTITKIDATNFTLGIDSSGYASAGTSGSCFKKTFCNDYTYS